LGKRANIKTQRIRYKKKVPKVVRSTVSEKNIKVNIVKVVTIMKERANPLNKWRRDAKKRRCVEGGRGELDKYQC